MMYYVALVNREDQYSVWPADRETPLGWDQAGFTGSREDCLQWIKEIWTDMQPRSLREKMKAGN